MKKYMLIAFLTAPFMLGAEEVRRDRSAFGMTDEQRECMAAHDCPEIDRANRHEISEEARECHRAAMEACGIERPERGERGERPERRGDRGQAEKSE